MFLKNIYLRTTSSLPFCIWEHKSGDTKWIQFINWGLPSSYLLFSTSHRGTTPNTPVWSQMPALNMQSKSNFFLLIYSFDALQQLRCRALTPDGVTHYNQHSHLVFWAVFSCVNCSSHITKWPKARAAVFPHRADSCLFTEWLRLEGTSRDH